VICCDFQGKIWENFFEKKFSQPLSKNFDWSLAVRARRGTKALENLITLVGIVTIMVYKQNRFHGIIQRRGAACCARIFSAEKKFKKKR